MIVESFSKGRNRPSTVGRAVVVQRQVESKDAERSPSAITHEQQLGQYRRSTCGLRLIC
jgi:hypothetical protein